MTRIPRSWRRRTAVAAMAGAAVLLAACGTNSSNSTSANPQQAVHDSLSGVTKQSSLGFTISLGLSASQIEQLSKQNSGSITSAQAQAISSGSIFFYFQSGGGEALSSKTVAKDSQNKFDVGLNLDGSAPFELRVLAENVYLHVDLSTLENDVGEHPATLSHLQQEGSAANAYVPGISDLLAGQWVEASHASLQPLLGLLKSFESSEGASSSGTSAYVGEFTKARNDLAQALKANSTTTKVGTSGGQNEYQLTVQLKPFLQAVSTALQTDLSSLPDGVGAKYSQGLNKVEGNIAAGQTLVLNLFEASNQLKEIDVNIDQFLPAAKRPNFPVTVKVVLSNPTISAPSGAAQLNLSKLPSLLGGLGGSLGGSSGSSSDSSST